MACLNEEPSHVQLTISPGLWKVTSWCWVSGVVLCLLPGSPPYARSLVAVPASAPRAYCLRAHHGHSWRPHPGFLMLLPRCLVAPGTSGLSLGNELACHWIQFLNCSSQTPVLRCSWYMEGLPRTPRKSWFHLERNFREWTAACSLNVVAVVICLKWWVPFIC